MWLTPLKSPAQQQVTVRRFLGIDARESGENGGFAAMCNLGGRAFPALGTRQKRGLFAQGSAPGGLIAKDALCWVEGGTFYVNGVAAEPVLTSGKKQLVSMGAYVIIWPDKVYVNTRDLTDWGSLEHTAAVSGTVETALCDSQGEIYDSYVEGDTAPAQPESGTLWLQKGELRRYDGAAWQQEETFVRWDSDGIDREFAPGDGVEILGSRALSGLHTVCAAGEDYLVLNGPWQTLGSESGTISLCRRVPDMDLVVECNNRLWGCKYGQSGGRAVNEIYASALGDFKNFYTYAGLSTDAYAAQRGSDGPFTAAVSFQGSPLFFKENGLEKVYISPTGAHQIVYTPCPGVARHSQDSVQVVGSSLYYLGYDGVYRYDGAMPVKVSHALGDVLLSQGVAGGDGEIYCLSALEGTRRRMLCYHTARQLWYEEEDPGAVSFAAVDAELYCQCQDGSIWALHGTTGEKESGFSWRAESGDWGLEEPRHKYVRRLDLRVKPEKGGCVTVKYSTDGGRTFTRAGSFRGHGGVEPQRLTLRLRRAPQVRLALEGTGSCVLYAVTAIYEEGSDVV